MTIYLVLYDRRGQCQHVAIATNESALRDFLDAGFVQVEREEYERCAALVDRVGLEDLPLIIAAAELLARVLTRRQPDPASVNPARGRQALRQIQSRLDTELETITGRYLAGELSAEQWQRRMMDTINSGNIATRQVAVGGAENLSQADIRAIERANETQAQFLNRFRRDLEAGNLSQRMALHRAKLYSGSTTPVFEEGLTRAIGLPPLPAYPGVRTQCRANCKCNWDIRQLPGTGNWDCFWDLAAAEHCPTCIQRNRTFSPLRIRNGLIQPFSPSGIYAS